MKTIKVSVTIEMTVGERMEHHFEEFTETLEKHLEEHLVYNVPAHQAQTQGLPLVGIDVDQITVEKS